MDPKDIPTNDKYSISQSVDDSKPPLMGGRHVDQEKGRSPKDYSDHWKVLLGEFIHLLGLFWVHSQTAKAARASEVLFNQLLQHLNILEKMPNHDGGILVRRLHHQPDAIRSGPDYLVLFGSEMINSKQDVASAAAKQFSHLKSALGGVFEYFEAQGIHSLYLRIPGRSAENIEHFRYSMHILTRFYMAATDDTAIAFRYYGRSLTIPLISDTDGRPDPNLTVMAALNGLSAVNARELIRQADAYHKINMAEFADASSPQLHISCYDRIFKVRSLRSQIIKPPVEINNLICPESARMLNNRPLFHSALNGPAGMTSATGVGATLMPIDPLMQVDEPVVDTRPAIDRQKISGYLDSTDPLIRASLDALFTDDYPTLEPAGLGERFASISLLLYAIDKRCQDPAVIESVIETLLALLKGVPDNILANIITQRQGLKIVSRGQAVLVGLVHPRLFNLVTLIKEYVVVRQRMGIIKEIAFQVDPCHINLLADGFGISVSDAHQIFGLLKGCFGANGTFIRPTFESRIDGMTHHENVIFEILWCFLKQTPRRKDRLNFINAIQLLMARLKDPKRAIQFLMADICQNPFLIDHTDRNAFALANVMLHKENRELYVDLDRTPEDVLKIRRPLNQNVRRYAIWRLEVDQGRYLSKLRTIANSVDKVLKAAADINPEASKLAFLLALEREAFIFCALVKGHASRVVLREALARYGDPKAPLYQLEAARQQLPYLISHLQIVVRALGRAGNHEDIERLKSLEHHAKLLSGLDVHPAHRLRVKQMMKWVPEAIRMIQLNNSRP